MRLTGPSTAISNGRRWETEEHTGGVAALPVYLLPAKYRNVRNISSG